MNLKPVVTSLFLMGLACGSVLAEGLEDSNADGMGDVAEAVGSDGSAATLDADVVAPEVRLSGKVNVDFAKRDFKQSNYFNYSPTLGQLWEGERTYLLRYRGADGHFGGNFQLNIDAAMGDNSAHMSLLYSMDDDNGQTVCNGSECASIVPASNTNRVLGSSQPESLSVTEGYVQMKNMMGTPFVLTWGHGYTDFGISGVDGEDFSRVPLIKSQTQMLTQTRANFVKFGLSDIGMKGFFISGYFLDHKNVNNQGNHFNTSVVGRQQDKIEAYGLNAGYNFATKFISDEQWGFAFGMVSNPGAADVVEINNLNTAKNAAYSFAGHLRMSGFELDGSYVRYGRIYNPDGADTADRRTRQGDTIIIGGTATTAATYFGSSVTTLDSPAAWDVKLGYVFADTFGPGASTKAFFRYGQTDEAIRLLMPRSTYMLGLKQGLGNGASLLLSMANQTNYDKKNTTDGTYMTVDGIELKGSSNKIMAARLSYEF